MWKLYMERAESGSLEFWSLELWRKYSFIDDGGEVGIVKVLGFKLNILHF